MRPSRGASILAAGFACTTGYVATRLVATGVTGPGAWLATLVLALLTTGSLFAVVGLFGGLLITRFIRTAHAPAPPRR